jgi:DNA polymerase-3 subunit epsilon
VSALDPAKILFLDCQTTGMHPSLGQILELAWESPVGSRAFVIALGEHEKLSARTTDITGITAEHLLDSVSEETALSSLEADLAVLGDGAVVVVHYAQFERAFLAELFERLRGTPLPFRFLCTFKIARLLHPDVPSRNIRALVGFLGLGSSKIHRASEHVAATKKIWESLTIPVTGLEAIELWLSSTKAPKAAKTSFRFDRLKRLQLPDRPGIYRMLAQDGRVLYVGKATSLHSRVNSYFRGKGQGKRKREMISQVWDIQITECGSALEAALLETEEIKRLDPPYNVVLKTGRRALSFFSRDFLRVSVTKDSEHPMGPFGRINSIAALTEWLAGGEPIQLFYDAVPKELRTEGRAIFLSRHGFASLPSARSLVAFGARLARERNALLELEGEAEMEEEEEAEEVPLSAEDVAERYESLSMRAAWEYLRSKRLTRLLNCRVHLEKEGRVLEIKGGRLEGGSALSGWESLGLADYDRMSVLLSEITRHAYPVERAPLP